MTNDWDPGLPAESDIPEDDYRRDLRDALNSLGFAGLRMADLWRLTDPSEESPAAAALAEQPRWVVPDINPSPIREAFQNLQFVINSGHDHVQSLGLALVMRRELGTSLLTILRGALEAYAQAHFLMGDLTVRNIMVRHLAPRRSVLDFGIIEPRGADRVRRPTPYSIESNRMMGRVKALQTAWGFTWEEIDPIKPGASVQAVLDLYSKSTGHDIPPGIYGLLSETAHSETVGFRHFLRRREELDPFGRPTYTVGLNYDFLNSLVRILVGVHFEVTKRYLFLCGAAEDDAAAAWIETVKYCDDVTDHIRDEVEESRAGGPAEETPTE